MLCHAQHPSLALVRAPLFPCLTHIGTHALYPGTRDVSKSKQKLPGLRFLESWALSHETVDVHESVWDHLTIPFAFPAHLLFSTKYYPLNSQVELRIDSLLCLIEPHSVWKCLDMSYSTGIDFAGILLLANSATEPEQSEYRTLLLDLRWQLPAQEQ